LPVLYRPGAHDLQLELRCCVEMVPASQKEQRLLAATEKVPGSHSRHCVWPVAFWNSPAAQRLTKHNKHR
jgi:hypothetical protein